MIKFRCKSCQHKIAVPNDYEGRHVKCPSCGEPTLVRQEVLDVQVTEAGRRPAATAVAATATATATRPVRTATPSSAARPAQMPQGRTIHRAPDSDGLATSQASELLKALDDAAGPASTTSLDAELTLDLERELVAEQAAPAERPSAKSHAHHHVPHANPPHYIFLQLLGIILMCLGAMSLMIWAVLLVAILAGSEAVGELALIPPRALAGPFAAWLIGILWVIASGQALLALRDIARHSWYHKEAAALLRR